MKEIKAYTLYALGENIEALIYFYDAWDCKITLHGSGYMYDDAKEFCRIGVDETKFTSIKDIITLLQKDNVSELLWKWSNCIGSHKSNLIIPDGIKSIASHFMDCMSTWMEVPLLLIGKDVEYIGDRAFPYTFGSYGVQSVISYSNVLTKLGKEAFSNPYLINADFNGTVTEIGEKCFCECAISSLNLSTELKYIGNRAFENCASLTSFNSGNVIDCPCENDAFKYCNSLSTLFIGDNFRIDTQSPNTGDMSSIFYLDKYKGSNCNEEGLQKTKITTNNLEVIAFDWTSYNRDPEFIRYVDLIYCKHEGKWIKIKVYDREHGSMPICHDDLILWIRLLDQSSYGTPIYVKHNNTWCKIGY